MKLFEVVQLNEKSQLAFLDLKKSAINVIHKQFKLKADTVFKPLSTKVEIKQALKDGEMIVGFNPDGTFIAMGEKETAGTWTTGKPKYGWIFIYGDADKPSDIRRGPWVSNLTDAVSKISPFYKNVFASVNGRYNTRSADISANDDGLDKLYSIRSEVNDRFDSVVKKVIQQTTDKISDEIASLLKSGDTKGAEEKIRDLKIIKANIGQRTTDLLKNFMYTVYDNNTGTFDSDLGYALQKKKIEDSKFMLKLGLFLLKKAKGEQWSKKIFKKGV